MRYYEEIGLPPEAIRTPAGYRLYDDQTLERLAFISRAKQLGCTLDEIADLTGARDGGRCGPVQDRRRTLVADKLVTAQQQIVDVMTLTSDLQLAAATLEGHPPTVHATTTGGASRRGQVRPQPRGSRSPCTRSPIVERSARRSHGRSGRSRLRGRLDEWQRLLKHVGHRESIDNGLRATFGPATPLDELMRLAAAEQDCCQFFTFAITVDSRGVAVEERAPRRRTPGAPRLVRTPDMRAKKENMAVVGVGALARAACCAGPILWFLTAIGLGTTAGSAMFGAAALAIGALAILIVLRRRCPPRPARSPSKCPSCGRGRRARLDEGHVAPWWRQ